MLDYVIRNARVPGAANGGAVDIGFSKGKIAAIEPKLVADSPSYDAQGCLCCGGLVETHIHLDKSRIIDRCTPEPSRANPNHMPRVQAVKPGFTVEDIYNRAKITLENCIKQGTNRLPWLTKTIRPDLNHPTQRPRRILGTSRMRRMLHHQRHRVAPATR